MSRQIGSLGYKSMTLKELNDLLKDVPNTPVKVSVGWLKSAESFLGINLPKKAKKVKKEALQTH